MVAKLPFGKVVPLDIGCGCRTGFALNDLTNLILFINKWEYFIINYGSGGPHRKKRRLKKLPTQIIEIKKEDSEVVEDARRMIKGKDIDKEEGMSRDIKNYF